MPKVHNSYVDTCVWVYEVYNKMLQTPIFKNRHTNSSNLKEHRKTVPKPRELFHGLCGPEIDFKSSLKDAKEIKRLLLFKR